MESSPVGAAAAAPRRRRRRLPKVRVLARAPGELRRGRPRPAGDGAWHGEEAEVVAGIAMANPRVREAGGRWFRLFARV